MAERIVLADDVSRNRFASAASLKIKFDDRDTPSNLTLLVTFDWKFLLSLKVNVEKAYAVQFDIIEQGISSAHYTSLVIRAALHNVSQKTKGQLQMLTWALL